jgi:hypothetical protein
MDDIPSRAASGPRTAGARRTRPPFAVFEAVNEATQEIYLGMTAGPCSEVLGVLRAAPPPALSGWDFSSVTIRGVEYDLDRQSALGFLNEYARTLLPRGWRFLR